MVAGVGLGKVVPILFGLFLSREFGAASFAGFVLLLTYVAALAALPSLGATPQIIRAGVHDDPARAVVRTALASLMLTLLLVALSALYWMALSSAPLLHSVASPGAVYVWVGLYAAGLVLFALAQSTCSLQGRHLVVGLSAVATYGGAAIAGLLAGKVAGVGAALGSYFAVFALSALVFFGVSQYPLRSEWRGVLGALRPARALESLCATLGTSLFGLVTLVGLYLVMHSAQARMTSAEGATFALAFQLFQAGIFLPSVLGALVVPRLVSAQRQGGAEGVAALGRRTLIVYLGLGLAWLLVVAVIARPLLALYGLEGGNVGGLLLLQVAGVLASLQAYFIQSLVAQGRFAALAAGSVIWVMAAWTWLQASPAGVMSTASALVVGYGVCLGFYAVLSRGANGPAPPLSRDNLAH